MWRYGCGDMDVEIWGCGDVGWRCGGESDSELILNGILDTVTVISMPNRDYKHHHRRNLGQ